MSILRGALHLGGGVVVVFFELAYTLKDFSFEALQLLLSVICTNLL